MASYQSGFDPPTRPGETSRARRLGTYMQQNPGRPEKLEHREADIAHLSGQMDTRRTVAPAGRSQQTVLPRSRMREPSPSTRPKLEGTKMGSSSSSFKYSRNVPKPVAKPTPELRGKPSRNVLRRKPSSVAQDAEVSRPRTERQDSSSTKASSTSTSSGRRPSMEATQKSSEAYNEIFTRPPRTRTPATKEPPQIYPELDRYRIRPEQNVGSKNITELPPKLSTQDLPPHNPLNSGTPVYSGGSSHHRYSGYSGSGYSASPSTRFSESPGPGAYSRDTTPTSNSSQSPGILAPMKTSTTPRLRQGSPAVNRPPPVTVRRRAASISTEPDASPQGLPSLRESITSSSSNSTVKGDGKGKEKEKKKKKRLSPMPPSPPPRKSSQKFKKDRSETPEASPSKPSQAPAKLVMVSPTELPPARQVRAVTSPISRSGPPLRPSREGAPDLHAQLGDAMPIVQSNLTGLLQNRRQSALPMPRSAGTSPQLSNQPTFRPQPRRKNNTSPSPIIPSREATPGPSGLGIIPDLRPHPPASRSISRTPSPSISNTKSRFGLFGRRTKTTPEVNTLENRGSRKGPAAGTGHEGYGKYATRGRSSSAGGYSSRQGSISLSVTGSTSQESISSTRTHDPFLLHRMSPVIIAGGGEIIENRNEGSELLRTESGTSILLGGDRRPHLERKVSNEVSRTTLWPSALPKDPVPRRTSAIVPKGRRISDSSDDGVAKRSLAFRRSVQRLDSTGPVNLPRPLNFGDMVVSPSMTSLDASVLSDESQLEIGIARKGVLSKPKKLEKKPKETRKWNFFHRSKPNEPPTEPVPPMPVVVGKAPAKAVPHYALLDSSDEQLSPGAVNLEDLLRDVEVVAMSNEELDALQFGSYKENTRSNGKMNMNAAPTPAPVPEPTPMPESRVETPPAPILFSSPEPMQMPAERPKTPPQTDLHLTQEPVRIRPSRLPQVGRIPKVISARPETTSPKSFSRPFARLSTLQPLTQPLVIDKESVAVGPSPPKPSTPELPSEPQPEASRLPTVRQESVDSKSSLASTNHRDFLSFSPRKNSEGTTSSSGGGLSFADTTAVIPLPDDPLEEDEMWDEYDDLIETNEDTVKLPPTPKDPHMSLPFQYESFESRRMKKSKVIAKESPTLTETPVIAIQKPERGEVRASSSVYSVDMSAISKDKEPERSSALTSSSVYSVDMSARLKDALTSIPSPTTPLSFTEFFSGYGDRNNSVHAESAQRKRRSSGSKSRKSNSSSTHSRSMSGLVPIAEQDASSPISQVNLRVGSMTVSKWLTFGHVLFSPAREEIADSSKRHSILVIDGLGNDDWSFYAAETYPNCTFYNLSPTAPPSLSSPQSPNLPSTPPNHRQIQYPSASPQGLQKFPFPSSTFNIVVFRFPPISSLPTYRHLISESKRCLKPGGYLELAILDLDMLNMGPITRRAVRGLKVRLAEREEGVSLGSASDEVLKLVGKRGLGEVRSCVVGVPVVGAVCGGDESVNGATIKGKGKEKEVRQELSLPDLLHTDRSEGTDADITKMVAKVGRWWYERCYESSVLGGANRYASVGGGYANANTGSTGKSIFSDPKVLNECEEWGSSFKLCVGVARKPSLIARRRGASV